MAKDSVRKDINKAISDKEDNRDIFEKAFDSGGVAIPAALMAGGALVGSRLGKSAARKGGKWNGPGREVYDDYRLGGAITGGALGAAAGMPIIDAGIRNSKKARK